MKPSDARHQPHRPRPGPGAGGQARLARRRPRRRHRRQRRPQSRRPPGCGTVTIHASRTDQEGRGHTRYLGVPTVSAVQRWMQAAGISAGRCSCGSAAVTLPAPSRWTCGRSVRSSPRARQPPGSPIGSAVTRFGLAQRSRSRPPAPVWSSCSRPATGRLRRCRPATGGTSSPPAVRSPSCATRPVSRGRQGARRAGVAKSYTERVVAAASPRHGQSSGYRRVLIDRLAMNKESVRKQSFRSWLDRLRASALYQHEVPHGCR